MSELAIGTGRIEASVWPGDWCLHHRDANGVFITWRFSRNQRHLAVQFAERRGIRIVPAHEPKRSSGEAAPG